MPCTDGEFAADGRAAEPPPHCDFRSGDEEAEASSAVRLHRGTVEPPEATPPNRAQSCQHMRRRICSSSISPCTRLLLLLRSAARPCDEADTLRLDGPGIELRRQREEAAPGGGSIGCQSTVEMDRWLVLCVPSTSLRSLCLVKTVQRSVRQAVHPGHPAVRSPVRRRVSSVTLRAPVRCVHRSLTRLCSLFGT
jgi:hypothetical protein